MNRGILLPVVAIVLVFLVGVGLFFAKSYLKPTKPANELPSITPTQANVSASDNLPSLYDGVEWGEPIYETFLFTNKDNKTVELQGQRLESETYEDVSIKFINYYQIELKNRGWEETLAAGGPPGEIYGYQKGNKYINVGVEYTPDQPGPDRPIISYTVYIEHN